MNEQHELKEITKALINFQKQVPKVTFNKENPYFKSRYADLPHIIDTTKEALTNNGLAVTQLVDTTFNGNGEPIGVINTILMHESGQYINAKTFYALTGKPQEQGSAITYMRRYALSAILGISSDEDDDANVASGKETKTSAPVKKDLTDKDKQNFKAALDKATTKELVTQYEKAFRDKFKVTDARDLEIKALIKSALTRILE